MSTTGISDSALNEALSAATADVERISNAFQVEEKGQLVIPKQMHADFTAAVSRAREIKSVIDGRKFAAESRDYLEAPVGTPIAAADAGARRVETKSLADVFLDSEQFKAAQANGFRDMGRIRGEFEGKSIFSLSAGTIEHQAFGQLQNTGLYETKVRQWHVRDLFPKSTTKAPVLTGIRETGFTNNAAQISETTGSSTTPPNQWVKANRSTLTFKPVIFPVCEIAHTLQAHKNILSDEPRLKTFINQRMIEGVKFREDYDLLHSTGGADKITGIFETDGVQDYTGLATDQLSVQVRRAITKAQLAEYAPTGIVLSPTMFEEVEVEEDQTGAFRVAVSVAIGAEKRLWTVPIIATTAMTDDNFLLGAFGQGAMLHDRENVSVSVSTENGSNFEEGVITVRADERLALEVVRPESFVIGTWTK